MRLTPVSETTVIRDLLRHLADARPLQRNPLAQEILQCFADDAAKPADVVSRIRNAVVLALETIEPRPADVSRPARYMRRLHTMIARCDLGGELHAAVARDLGISRPQFYRDRHEALVRLEAAIRTQLRAPRPVMPWINDFESQLSLATCLENTGDFAEAASILKEVALRTQRPASRAAAFRRLVQVLCEDNLIAEAQTTLSTMRRQVVVGEVAEDWFLVRASALAAEACIAAKAGRVEQATAIAEHGISILREQPADPRAHSLLGLFLIIVADAQCGRGAFENALESIDSARAFTDPMLEPGTFLLLHFYSAYAHLTEPHRIRQGVSTTLEALRIAQQNGCLRYASTAHSYLSYIYAMRNDQGASRRHAQYALFLAKETTPEHIVALSRLAKAEMALGRQGEATRLLRDARSHSFVGDPVISGIIAALEARMLGLSDMADLSAAKARKARIAFVACGMRSRVAEALLIEAAAYAKLGKRRAAVTAVENAVAAAESADSPYVLALAYRSSADIAGRRRHRRCSDEILSTIREQLTGL